MNLWELIKQELAQRLSAESYENWFGKTALRETDGDRICIGVPSEAARIYIEQEYSGTIWSVAHELRLGIKDIRYEVAGESTNGGPGARNGSFALEAGQRLNPKFTFDSFVVGPCNQFAHAAARAVAANPACVYNPLYIYGGVGMGKTHLMHAIGCQLLNRYLEIRVIYTPAERFMNEMISSMKEKRMAQFHARYRTADVLLVDDIQFLSGKETTQDEFFYTFNELHEGQKQIVLTSDSAPKDIGGIVERLRSRFTSGLMVDIQAPDLETKMAILAKKAEQERIELPDDVRNFLAVRTKSNVRELEGALLKLAMHSSVTGTPITLAMAHQALKHLVPSGDKRITIDAIIKTVAPEFDLTPQQIKQKSNERRIARPRQVSMYLAKQLTSASLPEIGRQFGGKHHTTVLHSIEVIEKLREKDQDLDKRIQKLMDTLQ